jgi:hypothetical protein
MFVHMKKIPAKTADALDLIIEFATLGEYGLEYPDTPAEDRTRTVCAPGRSRVRPSARTGRLRSSTAATGPAKARSKDCASKGAPTRATALPEALMPPRIRLDV